MTILMSSIPANTSGKDGEDSTAQENPFREKCYKCHEESVEYKEWQTSEHTKSLATLKKSENAQNSCLECHSSGYTINAPVWGSRRFARINMKTAQNAIACSSCHRHGAKNEHNLIAAPKKLCGSCHKMDCG
jgi:hypothetical protein